MKTNLLLYMLLVCLASCQSGDGIIVDSDNLLIGTWSNPVYEDETTTFKRLTNLPNESYGISFKQSGEFIERSSGWCGTPPLVFSDYEGTWELENEVIKITQQTYPNNYSWRIVSLTENELVIKRELSDQEKDYRELMELFDEIYALSTSVLCTDSSDWSFTAYGAKACGGPQGYIAYSKQIATVAFLEKVVQYTEAEKAYNIKRGIASTCDLPAQPSGIECQNGYPVFKY